MKICSACKVEKDLEFFGKDKSRKNGYYSQCKDCVKINRDKIKAARRVNFYKNGPSNLTEKYCSKCQTILPISNFWKQNHSSTGWSDYCKPCKTVIKYKGNQTYAKKKRLQIYNLSVNEFELLVENSLGYCAICKNKFDKSFHIDHDHKTGKVRGLLCSTCNQALGLMKDKVEYLVNAIEYLEKADE